MTDIQPPDSTRDAVAQTIHDALCSLCNEQVGTGLTIRSADLAKVVDALAAQFVITPKDHSVDELRDRIRLAVYRRLAHGPEAANVLDPIADAALSVVGPELERARYQRDTWIDSWMSKGGQVRILAWLHAEAAWERDQARARLAEAEAENGRLLERLHAAHERIAEVLEKRAEAASEALEELESLRRELDNAYDCIGRRQARIDKALELIDKRGYYVTESAWSSAIARALSSPAATGETRR